MLILLKLCCGLSKSDEVSMEVTHHVHTYMHVKLRDGSAVTMLCIDAMASNVQKHKDH